MARTTTSVYIEEDLVNRAKELDDRTFSELMEDLLRHYLEWHSTRSTQMYIQDIRVRLNDAQDALDRLEKQSDF